nr:MAG TPA: hypothetical protein [Caudoviricetes sp.]
MSSQTVRAYKNSSFSGYPKGGGCAIISTAPLWVGGAELL